MAINTVPQLWMGGQGQYSKQGQHRTVMWGGLDHKTKRLKYQNTMSLNVN